MKPEIYNDELFYKIIELVADRSPFHVLEIGSGAGGGSTQAFLKGAQQARSPVNIYCIEGRKDRYEKLKELEMIYRSVYTYNVASVPVEHYMKDGDIKVFYDMHPRMKNLHQYELLQIKSWKQEELAYITATHIPQNGIEIIKAEHNIQNFDMVLVDGSPFTAKEELRLVDGAGIIILDDVDDIKNLDNYLKLKDDPRYALLSENMTLRNGYAIFERR